MASPAESTIFTAVAAGAGAIAGLFVLFDNWRRRNLGETSHLLTTVPIDVDAQPKSGVDPGLLLARGGASKSLETAISRQDASGVEESLASSDVLALGRPLLQPGAEGSELLHFEAETGELSGLLLPVFTQPDALRQALKDHPDWHEQSVLEFKGAEILSARGDEVKVVIDPWSELEFVLPPKAAPTDT